MNGADRFITTIAHAKIVALDSMCFIYHFEDHASYAPLTQELFELIEKRRVRAVTSVVTIAEVFSNEAVVSDIALAREYLALFESWPGLTIVDTTIDQAIEAGNIRTHYGLRLPDALQIAAAYSMEADVFVTNDSHFSKIESPAVIQLKDYRS